MSTLKIRLSESPPEAGRDNRQQSWTLARMLRWAAFGLCFVGSVATGAWAQSRTDPGDPPPDPGQTSEGWQILNIPGLPANALIGDVWAAPNGDVYVWATYPQRNTGQGITEGDPVEGERLPNPGLGSKPRSSTLYRYDGNSWTTSMVTLGETGIALYGTAPTNIYASTTAANGEARLYRFDGYAWTRQTVPGYYLGRLHTMAGVPGDMYFRIDRVIMHDSGNGMQPMYEMPGEDAPVRGLAYLDKDHVFMMCPDGCVLEHCGVFCDRPAGFTFADVEDVWGTRDAQGAVSLYVVGSNVADNGVRVWRFTETNPATHDGTWLCVLADPLAGGNLGIGCGMHISGTAANDIYATGMVAGEGRMFRFDGNVWVRLLPPVTLGAMHGVSATPSGTIWFTTEAGQLIRYQRPNIAAMEPSGVNAPQALPLQASSVAGGVRIRYTLPDGARIHLGVFDLAGRLCATVEDGFQTAGAHDASWTGGGLQPGIYFVKLRSNGSAFSRRVVILH